MLVLVTNKAHVLQIVRVKCPAKCATWLHDGFSYEHLFCTLLYEIHAIGDKLHTNATIDKGWRLHSWPLHVNYVAVVEIVKRRIEIIIDTERLVLILDIVVGSRLVNQIWLWRRSWSNSHWAFTTLTFLLVNRYMNNLLWLPLHCLHVLLNLLVQACREKSLE